MKEQLKKSSYKGQLYSRIVLPIKIQDNWGLVSWSFKHRTISVISFSTETPQIEWAKVLLFA